MLRNSFLTLLLLISTLFSLSAQIYEPVKWDFDNKSLGNGEYELIFTAKVDNGWYIYSQDNSGDGPVPTTFEFEEKNGVEVLTSGILEERGNLIDKHDKVFDMQVKKFKGTVDFVAKVKATQATGKISGYLNFMTCDDSKCLPPEDVEFSFEVSGAGSKNERTVQKTTTTTSSTDKPLDLNIGNSSGILAPVKWTFTNKPLGDDKYELQMTADIDPGWYVYSQNNSGDGPVPTTINFEETNGLKIINTKAEEKGKLIDKFDKVFGMQVKKFKEKIIFTNIIEVTAPTASLSGYVNYMTCDDTRCLPPDDAEFSFNFTKTAINNNDNNGTSSTSTENEETTSKNEISSKDDNKKEEGTVANDTKSEDNKTNGETATNDNTESTNINENLGTQALENKGTKIDVTEAILRGDFDGLIADCGKSSNANDTTGRSMWMIFLLGFLGGFAALLTPCVFPMIPLTVSFFTKRSPTKAAGIRNAIIYGLSIIVIYVTLGYLVTVLSGGPDTLNALSTNVWFNLAFFAIFVVFAISFFGYFEITLPNSWINKADEASDKGGLIGIFFMAFTLSLVSFSCTGPIIGTLLVDAAVSGEVLGPVIGMTGFALALALPFALFAAFPGWMNSLPKSGGWLNTVKVVLGFIELIFALKFLSNADMVEQWGILPREIFIGIWIVLFIGLGLYLLGKIKFPHDSPIKKLSPVRMGLGALAIAGSIYLATDFFGGNIGLVSGFPPPKFYSLFNDKHEGEFHGIRDLAKGISIAEKDGKPILLDFTGWACVNCRKMEENVWPKLPQLIEQYTLVSLYVDEAVKLPEEQQFTYELNGNTKRVRTVGNKWSYLQIKCFDNNAQPYYVPMTPDGQLLEQPVGNTPNVLKYSKFLQNGIDNYKKGKSIFGDNLSMK